MHDYQGAFAAGLHENRDLERPRCRSGASRKRPPRRTWKSLAAEDLQGAQEAQLFRSAGASGPSSRQEKRDIERLVADREMHRLATRLRSRDDNEEVKLVDAAIG